jgi:hypothetical protein
LSAKKSARKTPKAQEKEEDAGTFLTGISNPKERLAKIDDHLGGMDLVQEKERDPELVYIEEREEAMLKAEVKE